jgi:hypothetical protein
VIFGLWAGTLGYLAGAGVESLMIWAAVGVASTPAVVAWSVLVADQDPSDHARDRADKPRPEGRGGVMDLLARLGNVLYWIGAVLAFLLFVGGIWAYAAKIDQHNSDKLLAVCWIAAAISYGLGSALRYILAGGRRA